MPKPYSEYTKSLVVYYHRQGLKSGDISQLLQEEGIMASRREIAKFLAKYIESGSVHGSLGVENRRRRQPRFRRASKKPCARMTRRRRKLAYLQSSVSPRMQETEKRLCLHSCGKNSHTLATCGDVMTQRKYKTE